MADATEEASHGDVDHGLGHVDALLVVAHQPQTSVPIDLEKEITEIEFPLPGREEIQAIVHQLLQRAGDGKSLKVVEPELLGEALVDAALGLTAVEVQNALVRAVVDDLSLDFGDVHNMFHQKQQIVRKSAILEYCDVRGLSMSDAGGSRR